MICCSDKNHRFVAPQALTKIKFRLLVSAFRGAMMRKSVEMAIDEANASAKPGELPFELVVREDSLLWGSAANILVDLAFTDECLAVVGSIDSTATHVALRVALKAEIFI